MSGERTSLLDAINTLSLAANDALETWGPAAVEIVLAEALAKGLKVSSDAIWESIKEVKSRENR